MKDYIKQLKSEWNEKVDNEHIAESFYPFSSSSPVSDSIVDFFLTKFLEREATLWKEMEEKKLIITNKDYGWRRDESFAINQAISACQDLLIKSDEI